MAREPLCNLLTDRLPSELTVCGRRYPVYTDFRRWILVVELFAEPLVYGSVKVECAVKLIFPRDNPLQHTLSVTDGGTAEDTVKAYRELVRAITGFTSCGRGGVRGGTDGRETLPRSEPVFDFTQDAERIYAAFLQTYGIDLCDPSVRLHFWKFMALLRNLPRDTEFMQTVNLRMTDTTKIENDELRRRVRRAKANVRIRESGEEKRGYYYG